MATACMGLSHRALAAPGDCDRLQTQQQIDDGLSSTDPETRTRAQSCGLASPDRYARGLVIQKLLSGERLDFVIGNAPGDARSAEIVATFEPVYATRVKWTEDRKHFTGWSGNGNQIAGSMVGDIINVVFTQVRTTHLMSGCQARLSLNGAHDAMAGPLVCAQIPGRFTVQIDL